jgi:hypothetical protein
VKVGGSCPVVGFVISDIEPSGIDTRIQLQNLERGRYYTKVTVLSFNVWIEDRFGN